MVAQRGVHFSFGAETSALLDLAAARAGISPEEWLRRSVNGSLMLFDRLGGQPEPCNPLPRQPS